MSFATFGAAAICAVGRLAVGAAGEAGGVAGRVHDELMGVEVRAGVVEGVGEPGGARHADDDRDQRAQADRRERRAGPCPVPRQIPQREPYRDRAPLPGGGDHRQERRGEQHDGDGECDEADGEFQRPVALASAAASRSPGRAEQQERADQEAEADRDRQVAGLPRRGRAAGERGHDRDPRDRLRRPGGGEVGRDDRQGHGDADDRPRQLEHPHDVVRAVFRLRAVGEPGEEAEHGARDGAHDAGGGAVGPDDQADVPLRRALSGEHADRPQPALREDREAADRRRAR